MRNYQELYEKWRADRKRIVTETPDQMKAFAELHQARARHVKF